jgi:hypothetical protein
MVNKNKWGFAFTFLMVLISRFAGANDECSTAINLTPGNLCNEISGTFSGSTLSGNSPTCAAAASQDVWYRFVATEKTMGISLKAVGGLNHGFEVISGDCSGETVICVNNAGFGNTESFLGNNFTVGVTYYIRVFNANSLAVSLGFSICLQQFSSPTNDSCENAIGINAGLTCQQVLGSFAGSGMFNPKPNCFVNALQDIWYKFTATDSTMSISLGASSGLNHGFELVRGSCSGEVVNCVNSGASGNSEFLIGNNFVIGEQYYIRVFNAGAGVSTASFEICVRSYPAPLNDACNTATTLTPGVACLNTSNSLSGSDLDVPLPSCAGQASQDIWFKFTANDKTMSIALASSIGLNHGFEIYRENCSGELISCTNDNSSGIGEFYISSNFIEGATYYIRVFNVNPAYFTGSVNICVQYYPSPANENCSGATEIFPNEACQNISIRFAGSNIQNPRPSCANSASQDIWFRFTATQKQMSITLSALRNLNHGFEIFSDSCAGALLACVNDNTSGVAETYLNKIFIPGKTYFVRVFNASTVLNNDAFSICVQQLTPPLNDLCEQARIIVPQAVCTNVSAGFRGSSVERSAPLCAANAGQDVWFSFKASDSTMNVNLSAITGLNHGFEIFSGGCQGNSAVCVNNNGSGAVELFKGKIFIPGETYLLRVFNANPTLSQLSFNLCVFGAIQPCIATVEITADDSSVCEKTAVTFSASNVNGGPFPDFQWKKNGQTVGTNSSSFILENPSEGDKISCVMISSDPCANPASVASDTITLSVEDAIVPSFTTPGPFCEGTEFSLPSESGNGIKGSWTPEINVSESTTYTFTPAENVCADKAAVTVIIEDKVTPQFSLNAPVCRGTGLTLPSTSLNNITGSWQPAPNDTVSANYTFTPQQGQCASEATIGITILTVDTGITFDGNAIVSAAQAATFQWVNCNDNFAIIEGEIDSALQIIANGSYAVIVNQSGCIDTSSCVLISTVSLDDKTANLFDVSPNPVHETFTITASEHAVTDTYQIFSSTGSLILSGRLTGKSTSIASVDLKSGIYFIVFNQHPKPYKLIKL